MKGQKLVEEMSQSIIPESHLIKVLAICQRILELCLKATEYKHQPGNFKDFLHRDNNKIVVVLLLFIYLRESFCAALAVLELAF